MNMLATFWARHRLRLYKAAGIMVIMAAPLLSAVLRPNDLLRAGIVLGCAAAGFAIWARASIAEGDPKPPILADYAAHLPPPDLR